jgi:hypothetical protein
MLLLTRCDEVATWSRNTHSSNLLLLFFSQLENFYVHIVRKNTFFFMNILKNRELVKNCQFLTKTAVCGNNRFQPPGSWFDL